MHVRINITLPEQTVRLLDRIATKGKRSRIIDEAVREYVGKVGKRRLRKQLAEGYRQSAAEDSEIAAQWFVIDEEAWEKETQ